MTATLHALPATPDTVHWGYFDRGLAPVLRVHSRDLVAIETFTHLAGSAPDLLMDAEIRRVFEAVDDRGPGPHILTGPIYVEGAAPGDVLQVDILETQPRLPYGSNLAAHWGYLHKDFGKERVTVFELDATARVARAAFAYHWPTPPPRDPGIVIEPGSVRREPALEGVVVPMRPHFGTIGVAPAAPGRHSSVPPGPHGGNIDNWRTGVGGRMLYPVQVPGALLSMGDPHVSQGDGEVSGTALEASLSGLVRLTVRKDFALDTPLLETDAEILVHGFGDNLDEAMAAAERSTLELLISRYGLSRDDAHALCSVAVDFTVTQAVDTRVGVHGRVEKRWFPRWDHRSA
jgi:acetamidase/formamidase